MGQMSRWVRGAIVLVISVVAVGQLDASVREFDEASTAPAHRCQGSPLGRCGRLAAWRLKKAAW